VNIYIAQNRKNPQTRWLTPTAGFSANLGCRSETCCMWLAENTGRKESPSEHHRTNLSGYFLAIKAHIDNRKKNLLSSNTSFICPHNMVNIGPLAAEIVLPVWGIPDISTGYASWQSYCTVLQWVLAKVCVVEHRAPPIFGRAAITLGIGPHSSFLVFCQKPRLSFFQHTGSWHFL